MERVISLEDLAARHPQLEKDLPKGSLVVEKPPEPPSPLKRAIASIFVNIALPIVGGVLTLWMIHLLPISPEAFSGRDVEAPSLSIPSK